MNLGEQCVSKALDLLLDVTAPGVSGLAIFSIFGYKSFCVVEMLPKLPDVGGSVFFRVVDGYGPHATMDFYAVGSQHKAHPSNIYRTITDLIAKKAKVEYPDFMLTALDTDSIQQLRRDHPSLVGDKSLSDLVDYNTYWLYDYGVLVFDWERKWGHRFYWYIPELKVRSQEVERGRTGSGEFRSEKEAMDDADKFLSKQFYGESVHC